MSRMGNVALARDELMAWVDTNADAIIQAFDLVASDSEREACRLAGFIADSEPCPALEQFKRHESIARETARVWRERSQRLSTLLDEAYVGEAL